MRGVPTRLRRYGCRPAPADPAAQVRADAHAARRELVEALLKAAARSDPLDYPAAGAAVRRLADEAAAAGGRGAGEAWAVKWAAAIREGLGRTRGPAGVFQESKADVLAAMLALVEAEIDLARRRRAGPAALVPWYKNRVEILGDLEKLTEAAVRAGAATRAEYLARKAARLDADAELAALEAAVKQSGK
jgi:hypothetical protein